MGPASLDVASVVSFVTSNSSSPEEVHKRGATRGLNLPIKCSLHCKHCFATACQSPTPLNTVNACDKAASLSSSHFASMEVRHLTSCMNAPWPLSLLAALCRSRRGGCSKGTTSKVRRPLLSCA